MAGEMVRFGIIGTNFVTDRFLEAAKKVQGFQLGAVYSRTQQRATEYATLHGCSTTFTDLSTMAASDAIDAVYIASPTSCHAEHCLVFIANGKHVLCEKPACSTLHELEQVLEASSLHKVAFMEAMRTVHTPNFGLVKRLMQKQADGAAAVPASIYPVRHFLGSFSQFSSRYPAYLAGERPNAFLPEFSNGALMDLGCYSIYACVALFGPPTDVRYFPVMLDTGVDGSGTIVLQYGTFVATLLISKQAHSFVSSEIQGEGGTVSIDNLSEFAGISFQKKGGDKQTLTLEQDKNNMVYEVEAFIAMLHEGRQQDSTLSWQLARDVMTVLDKARRDGGIVFPADTAKPRI